MRASFSFPKAAWVCALMCLGSVAAEEILPGQATAERPRHAMGQVFSLDSFSSERMAIPVSKAPGVVAAADGGLAPWVILETGWQELDRSGEIDLAPLEAALVACEGGGFPVALSVSGRHPAYDRASAEGRRAWRLFLRDLARSVGEHVDWYLFEDIAPEPGSSDDAARAALQIKLSSNVVRAEDVGAAIGLRLRDASEADLLLRTYAQVGDLEPYFEAVSVAGLGHQALLDLRQALLPLDPGVSFWAETALPEETDKGGFQSDVLARSMDLFSAGADLALFPAGTDTQASQAAEAMVALRRQLPPELGVSPATGANVRLAEGARDVSWLRFFDAKNFQEVIAYWADDEGAQERQVSLVFGKAMRRGYRVLTPLSGQMRYAATTPAGEKEAEVAAPLSRQPRLIVVTRQKFSSGFELELEEAEVRGEHSLSAEEIIAAYQRFQEFQDDRLISIARDSEIKLRFRYALVTGTGDLTLRGDYFWDRQTGQDWAIREKFFNGVKVKWDKLPELPFVNQERAVQVPLRLDLDKRYRYEREKNEVVEGRQCWRLRFEPTVSDASLYKGRVWIDQATGAMVKMTTLQTNLEAPLISDEQTQIFRPYEAADGMEYWLPDGGEGQQIYTVQGSNLVIMRKVSFTQPRINEPGFYQERDELYASKLQMMRKTDEGFKWLARTDDGQREVVEEASPDQWFAVAGAYYDESSSTVIPLAGVNYSNIDFLGRGMLFNFFFAGAFANVSISNPAFLGSRLDLGVVGSFSGIKTTDKNFLSGTEIEGERVRRLTQDLLITAGYPIGNFVKARSVLAFRYRNYSDDDETAEGFVLPADHLETSVAFELGFDRKGWGLLGRYDWAQRSDWDPWGPDGALISPEETKRQEQYTSWTLGFQKSFFLPFFQKIEFSANTMAGRDLDRFSAFDFGFFSGNRVRGFSGSGIRFDRGTVGQLQYSFNLAEVVRFDAILDHGYVHDVRLSEEMTSHTGVGIAANFVGPWRTLVRLDLGYALKSDLREVEGDVEFLLVVLRLF